MNRLQTLDQLIAYVVQENKHLQQQVNVLKENQHTMENQIKRLQAQMEKLKGTHGY